MKSSQQTEEFKGNRGIKEMKGTRGLERSLRKREAQQMFSETGESIRGNVPPPSLNSLHYELRKGGETEACKVG